MPDSYQISGPCLSSATYNDSQHGSIHSEPYWQSGVEPVSYYGFEQQYNDALSQELVHQGSDRWILESPSTYSPLGYFKDATSPVCTEQLPLGCDVHEQQSVLYPDGATGYIDYGNFAQMPWELQCFDCASWNTAVTMCPGISLPVAEPLGPSASLMTAPENSFYGSGPPFEDGLPMDSVFISPPGQSSTGDGSEQESEGDSENDMCDDSDGSEGQSTSKTKSKVENPGFMTSKWFIGRTNTCNDEESRCFLCPLTGHLDVRGKACNARFVRPEHCRRHVKTVHGEERDHHCKVPGCNKGFSRGDNLRDHYWTHLHRGGRIGRNDKMSLAELKAILGKSEKNLVRKLRMKMEKNKIQHPGGLVKAKS